MLIQITSQGEIEIQFTRNIAIPDDGDDEKFIQYLLDEEVLELYILQSDFGEVIYGESIYGTSSSDQSTSINLRHLQGQRGDSSDDTIMNKNFKWTIQKITESRLNIQILFDRPEHISLDLFDKMQVKFEKPELILSDKFGNQAPDYLEVILGGKIPRQLDKGI